MTWIKWPFYWSEVEPMKLDPPVLYPWPDPNSELTKRVEALEAEVERLKRLSDQSKSKRRRTGGGKP